MLRKKSFIFGLAGLLFVAVMIAASFDWTISLAQSNDEKAVADTLRRNAAAFARNDMATLEKVWSSGADVTVFENGEANYGWADYRDNHLAPEMKEMKNTKYEYSDIKAKASGNLAFATMKYTISGDIGTRHVDGAGLATAVLEKMNGKWKIVHWHSSAPRRPPPTPTPKSS